MGNLNLPHLKMVDEKLSLESAGITGHMNQAGWSEIG